MAAQTRSVLFIYKIYNDDAEASLEFRRPVPARLCRPGLSPNNRQDYASLRKNRHGRQYGNPPSMYAESHLALRGMREDCNRCSQVAHVLLAPGAAYDHYHRHAGVWFQSL